MSTSTTVNLATTDQPSEEIAVLKNTAVSVMVSPGTIGWGGAAVELKWTIDDIPTTAWNSFNPPVYLSSTFPSQIAVHVAGVEHIRFETVKTDGTGDSAAEAFVRMSSTPIQALDPPRFIKELVQSRVSGTSATSIYNPAAGVQARVHEIWASNQSGANATCRVFYDSDGSTYDQTTTIGYDMNVSAGKTLVVESTNGIPLDWNGNLAVRVSVSNAITFTVLGIEF